MINEADLQQPKKKQNVLKKIAIGAAVVGIFSLGLFIGNGTISLGPDGALRKGSNTRTVSNLDFTSVEQVYDTLRNRYDGELDETKLLEGLKRGLVASTNDPYTEYLSPEETKEFNEQLNGTFSGIGAELSREDNNIVVVAPIAGYPAEKAGIRPRDIITEIDGQSAFETTVSEAVNKIRGPEGTKVKLKVVRDGSEQLEFEITREQINIPSVEHGILDGNIGYLKISRFGDDTAQLSKKAAEEFKAKGVKGVIVDVRSNPGGLLDASVDVASLWLPKGTTVLEEKRGGKVVKTFSSKGGDILNDIPTVALINEGSASASEILAGALRDNNAATLVGVKTFGKGSVQQLVELSNGGTLKVTIARWFTPAGKNIDKEGIEPDKKVELTAENAKNKQDPQKDAAIQFLNK